MGRSGARRTWRRERGQAIVPATLFDDPYQEEDGKAQLVEEALVEDVLPSGAARRGFVYFNLLPKGEGPVELEIPVRNQQARPVAVLRIPFEIR